VRGRLGWLPADPLLLYVTGGLAYGEINSSFNLGPVYIPSNRADSQACKVLIQG
jgi:opacity protein-like surface antigen